MRRHLTWIFLILIFLPLAAQARLFKDNQNNLYYFEQGKLKRSSDLGQNWSSFAAPLPASAVPLIFEDQSDQLLYLSWREKGELKLAYSRNAGLSFEKVVSLKNAPEIVDIQTQKGILQVLAVKEGKLLYLRSADRGANFSPVKILNETRPLTARPALLVTADKLEIDFISGNKIYRLVSADQGQSFSSPEELYTAEKALSELLPSAKDLFWLEKDASGQMEIRGLAQNLIFRAPSGISSPEVKITGQGAAVLSFHSSGDPYYILNGKDHKILSRTGSGTFSGLLPAGDELYAVWNNYQLEPIGNQKPTSPILLLPADNFKTNLPKLKVALSANDPDNDPLNYVIELSWDPIFPVDKTFTYLTASPEAEIPLSFPDGKYYLRAKAQDGLANSPYSSLLTFTLDREIPKIVIFSPRPGAITNKGSLEFSGTVTENCDLKLNGSPLPLSGLNFSKFADLVRGENRLVFRAVDGAGNASEETIIVIYDENAPVLTLIRPGIGDWYKKKSTVLIEAAVDDKQGDIEDEKDASLYIDDILQKQPLIYNQADAKLSELLTLPDDLTHGVHKIKIELTDSAGNLGRVEGTLNLDDSPPRVLEKSLLISKDKIVVPIAEEGSGLDAASSLLKVTQASIEVRGLVKKENQALVFYPSQPLAYGSYLLSVTPRDMIGNLGVTRNIPVVFDAARAAGAAAVSTCDVKILTLEYGPNPFRPSRDGVIKIKYELSGLAAAKLYIFSIEGNLILIKNLGSVVAGVTPWDGRNTFGEVVSSGLYPIALVATDSAGKREIKRGKLIVF